MTLDERIAYEGTVKAGRGALGLTTYYFQEAYAGGRPEIYEDALRALDEARECIVRLQAMGRPHEVEVE